MSPPVQKELERLGDRWRALSVAQAYAGAPRLGALTQALADRLVARSGGQRTVVPELGPAVVLDQLAVLVYDLAAAQADDDLVETLAFVRRSLS